MLFCFLLFRFISILRQTNFVFMVIGKQIRMTGYAFLLSTFLFRINFREQSLSMGETGAEGNGQGYEIFLQVMTGV